MSGRLRVLVPTMYYPPSVGGVQRLTREVTANMPLTRTRIVTPWFPRCSEYDAATGADVRRLRVGAERHHRVAVALFNTMAAGAGIGFSPDVVLSPHVLSAGAAAAAARIARVPMVQYLHAEEMTRRPGLSRAAIGASAALIVLSEHTEQLASGLGAKAEAMHRISPGTTVPDALPAADGGGPPTVVTVARMEDRFKGHDVMIDALPLVRERVPDVRWVVVGHGPLQPEYERLVAARGLREHVVFAGQIDDRERERLVAGSDVFCMPSRVPAGEAGEGFGIVYLEAGALGLPVVAGDAGGARDAVRAGETGLLVDPESPQALADALIGLLVDPARRSRMGQAGRRWAEEHTWAHVGARVQELLTDVAGRGR